MRVKKPNLLFLILIAVIGIELLMVKHPGTAFLGSRALSQVSLQTYAQNAVKKCASSSYHPTCYEKEISSLMDPPASLSMEDAFEVTRLVQGMDSSFPYCHVLGHELSAKEVRKDPSKWEDVVTRCPAGLCSNGCIHGGFQERFRTDSMTDAEVDKIKGDLENVCEKRASWNPTGMEQASCYHALGHLTMYITSANIKKAVSLCDEIALKSDGRDYRRLCYDGAFMQIFQPLEPEDFALIKGKEQTLSTIDAFCNQFPSKEKGSCISESWPLYRQDLMTNPQRVVDICSKEDTGETERCYDALFYVITAEFNFDLGKIENYCLALPKNVQTICFDNASSRLIETDYRNIDKSANLCTFAAQKTGNDACYQELLKYSTYNFHNGSEEMKKLCNRLPSPWDKKCLGQIHGN